MEVKQRRRSMYRPNLRVTRMHSDARCVRPLRAQRGPNSESVRRPSMKRLPSCASSATTVVGGPATWPASFPRRSIVMMRAPCAAPGTQLAAVADDRSCDRRLVPAPCALAWRPAGRSPPDPSPPDPSRVTRVTDRDRPATASPRRSFETVQYSSTLSLMRYHNVIVNLVNLL